MNRSYIENVSLAYIADQCTVSINAILLGLASFFTNLCVVITIWKTPSLHNKAQYCILSHSLAEALASLSMVEGYIRYSIFYLLSTPVIFNPATCVVLDHLFSGVTSLAAYFLSVCLALDRMLCIAAPIFYRTINTKTYMACFNIFSWLVPFLTHLLGIIGYDQDKLLGSCGDQFEILNKPAAYFLMYGGLIVPVLLLCFYAVTTAVLLYRYKKENLVGESQKSEWKKKMELNVLAAMAIVGSTLIAATIIRGALWMLIQSSMAMRLQFVILMNALMAVTLVNSGSHLFVYLKLSENFRKAFLKIFWKRDGQSTAVVPFSSRQL